MLKKEIPIIIGLFSHKGGCTKSTIAANLHGFLCSKHSKFKKSKIKIINCAPVTNSIISILSTFKEVKLINDFQKGKISEEEYKNEFKNIQNQLETYIYSTEKEKLSDILIHLKGKTKSSEIFGLSKFASNQQIFIVDFDGGSLEEKHIQNLAPLIDLWIIPCQPGSSSDGANDSILKLLVNNKVQGKNIIQLISPTREHYSDLTWAKARKCIADWSTEVINFIDIELYYYRNVDSEYVWIQRSKAGIKNFTTYQRIHYFIDNIFNKINKVI